MEGCLKRYVKRMRPCRDWGMRTFIPRYVLGKESWIANHCILWQITHMIFRCWSQYTSQFNDLTTLVGRRFGRTFPQRNGGFRFRNCNVNLGFNLRRVRPLTKMLLMEESRTADWSGRLSFYYEKGSSSIKPESRRRNGEFSDPEGAVRQIRLCTEQFISLFLCCLWETFPNRKSLIFRKTLHVGPEHELGERPNAACWRRQH